MGPAWGAPSPRHYLPGLPLQAPRRRPSGQASTPPQDSGLPPGPSATPAAGLVPTCLSTWEPLSAPILPRPPRQTSQRRPRGWDVSVPGPGVPAQVPERLPGAGTPPRLLYALGSRPSVPQRPSSVRDAPPPASRRCTPSPSHSATPPPGTGSPPPAPRRRPRAPCTRGDPSASLGTGADGRGAAARLRWPNAVTSAWRGNELTCPLGTRQVRVPGRPAGLSWTAPPTPRDRFELPGDWVPVLFGRREEGLTE